MIWIWITMRTMMNCMKWWISYDITVIWKTAASWITREKHINGWQLRMPAVSRNEDSLNPKEFKVTASCQEGRWTRWTILFFLRPETFRKVLGSEFQVLNPSQSPIFSRKVSGRRPSLRWPRWFIMGWSPRSNCILYPPNKGEHDEWYYIVSPYFTSISGLVI